MSPLKRERPAQWRSLGDREGRSELRIWREGEFPEGFFGGGGPDRREFLKLMGASLAMLGAARCRWPAEPIVPFAHRPEGYVPGAPKRYATAMELAGAATGLLVTSYDGRPIKIEGNPRHPYSLGGTSAWHQASLLGLYDPDRSRHPVQRAGQDESRASWEAAAAFLRGQFAQLAAREGRGLYVLAAASSSPTLGRLRARLLEQEPRAEWLEYEPFSHEDAEREGTRLACGQPLRVHPRFDRARVVLLLDADPWLAHPAAVRYIHDFSQARRGPAEARPRVWAVEAAHSLSGSLADHRLPLRPSELADFAVRLAAQLFLGLGLAPPAGFGEVRALEAWRGGGRADDLLGALARDLWSARGDALILAGPRVAPEIHALVYLLNHALGSAGRAVTYTEAPEPSRAAHAEAIRRLADRLEAGRVDTLLLLDVNPAFDAPADLEFARRLEKAKTAIHVGPYRDETARLCAWHLPLAHYLESWGDARAWDGTWSIVQPLIEPLWEGRTAAELLSLCVEQAPQRAYALVRETFRDAFGPGAVEDGWRQALHEGLVEGTAWREVMLPVARGEWWDAAFAQAGASAARREGWELVFCLDAKVYDGRFANNAWLQELPDPMTKLTWDNALLLAPRDAQRLGVTDGDLVRVQAAERALELPALVLPGQAPGSASVALGYGRRAAGAVGGGVGAEVQTLRPADGRLVAEVRLERTGARRELACTQDHWTMDRLGAAERELRARRFARQVELRDFLADPHRAVRGEGEFHPVALWREHTYPGHRWAMAIDLDACVGCGACVVACQAENNVPVVGKREVLRGHEMHWIRVDRYFSGDPEAPSVHHQPVTCHHCENAPCESVCPVAATVHDSEGLNVMVYNRCIGTRYCSNNCPYKVRRFNWFHYTKKTGHLEAMVFNPEVTVRSRGVMEKCTFCVQRIQSARIAARREGRELRDGDVVPACAQACPAQAIVFGDLNDPGSRVRAAFDDARAYALLEEQNVRPRLRYLARLLHRTGRRAEG